MKKSYIIYGMIATATVMACNKIETNEQIVKKAEQGVIYAETEPTKTAIYGTGDSEHVEWVKGDEVKVYPTYSSSDNGVIYTAQSNGSSVSFSGDALTGYYAAAYPASYASTCTSGPKITATVPSEQDGSFHNMIFAGVPTESGKNQFIFTAVTSVIKIDVPSEKNIIKIKLESSSDICGKFTTTYNSGNWTTTNYKPVGKTITVSADPGKIFSGPVYIAVLPNTSSQNITITLFSADKYGSKTNSVDHLNVNTIENFGSANADINFYGKGFTINKNGEQIFFAPGNLWCDASSDSVSGWTWHFESNQYDSDTGIDVPKNAQRPYNPSHVSHFYYSAWGIDKTDNGFGAGPSRVGGSPTTGVDFGKVFGNDSEWTVLRKDELNYILNTRATSAIVGETTNARYSMICIKDVKEGILIYPDVFYWDTNLYGEIPSKVNATGYTEYSLEIFEEINKAGAAFLPANGHRNSDGKILYAVAGYPSQINGYYSYLDGSNLNLLFSSGSITVGAGTGSGNAYSVRLVTSVSPDDWAKENMIH